MRILYLWPGIVRHCRNFVSGNDKLSLFEALGMGKCACGRISFGTPIACIRNVTRCLSADGARSLVSCKTFGEEDLVHCTSNEGWQNVFGKEEQKAKESPQVRGWQVRRAAAAAQGSATPAKPKCPAAKASM